MASNTPQRILNAAGSCYQKMGILKASMEDIATEAGISRRTLYRHFANQQEILSFVIQEAASAFLEGLSESLKNIQQFDDFFVEALLYSIEKGPAVSSHSFLFGRDILPIMNDLYLSSEDFRVLSTSFWREELLKRNDKKQVYLDIEMISEWFNRIVLSYLATPSPLYKSKAELQKLFSVTVKPALTQ
ncbi:TetR/AcrR family transcriptional regulator [Endozoicomonas sp.]|uniref:TetR/AcrR family transcriptional regulator n=1 Tax=Endozoicomonas sp. TaxID=1892382 RepID=UPI00288765FC|nr:TetR/AcrR family transcriptional regulator [Endozoicomonas sp.]